MRVLSVYCVVVHTVTATVTVCVCGVCGRLQVRRSRDKAKHRLDDTLKRVKNLQADNEDLQRRLDSNLQVLPQGLNRTPHIHNPSVAVAVPFHSLPFPSLPQLLILLLLLLPVIPFHQADHY